MAQIRFQITCTMDEKHYDEFIAMLNHIEEMGKLNKSPMIDVRPGGKNGFNPTFDIGHYMEGIMIPDEENKTIELQK